MFRVHYLTFLNIQVNASKMQFACAMLDNLCPKGLTKGKGWFEVWDDWFYVLGVELGLMTVNFRQILGFGGQMRSERAD